MLTEFSSLSWSTLNLSSCSSMIEEAEAPFCICLQNTNSSRTDRTMQEPLVKGVQDMLETIMHVTHA